MDDIVEQFNTLADELEDRLSDLLRTEVVVVSMFGDGCVIEPETSWKTPRIAARARRLAVVWKAESRPGGRITLIWRDGDT